MAAPLVAGAAVLVRGAFPYLTAPQTQEILLTTTNSAGHLADRAIYGRGMLDANRATRGPGEFGAERFSQRFDVDTRGMDSTWSNDIIGSGGPTKRGAGNLTLSGTNTYRGATLVKDGRMTVTGATAASQFHVEPLGTLSGTGVVGSTLMGGTIEAGQRLRLTDSGNAAQLTGALTVAGDYTHLPSGTFVASISPDGASNQLNVQGAAELQGGTMMVHDISPQTLGQRYALIRARDGVTGDFAHKPNDLLFFDLKTGITNYHYTLSIDRNPGGFGSVANSANQRAVAHAMDQMPLGKPVFDALLMTRDAGVARTALTQLAGNIHPSTLGVLGWMLP
jgi:subtilase-type serine protease